MARQLERAAILGIAVGLILGALPLFHTDTTTAGIATFSGIVLAIGLLISPPGKTTN